VNSRGSTNSGEQQMSGGDSSVGVAPNLSNLQGRMMAVYHDINSLKQDFLVAQNTVVARNGVGSSSMTPVHLLNSSSAGTFHQEFISPRSLVLGLPAAPLTIIGVTRLARDVEDDVMDTESEMRKRKRMLAANNGKGVAVECAEAIVSANGDNGVSNLGMNVSNGGISDMNVVDNPLFDEYVVSAGPGTHACWGP
jgi:hypothetical protein